MHKCTTFTLQPNALKIFYFRRGNWHIFDITGFPLNLQKVSVNASIFSHFPCIDDFEKLLSFNPNNRLEHVGKWQGCPHKTIQRTPVKNEKTKILAGSILKYVKFNI